jgi:4-diphosphocytidyl-2C-methyl-D-erythritol kinase
VPFPRDKNPQKFYYAAYEVTVLDKITLDAPAKLNLWLEVCGRRPDGYHDIYTVMYTVNSGLYDTVELELTPQSGVSFEIESGADLEFSCVPANESNLAYRAAQAFFGRVCEYDPGASGGVKIKLVKRIPAGAGLGGGSSDAGAVLRGLNLLFGNPIPVIKLREAGRSLGADVPFCVSGGVATASGIGDILGACPEPPEFCTVIAMPRDPVKTVSAYAALDMLDYTRRSPDAFLAALESGDRNAFCAELFNRFEDVSPTAASLKFDFKALGSAGSCMSGSGSAVFGLFGDRRDALHAEKALRQKGFFAKLCV